MIGNDPMKKDSHKGFVLLFAVLVASVVLAIGTGLYNIASKELILSRASRDSQFAFFAADAGSECAFFWDRKYFLVEPTKLSAFPANSGEAATLPHDVKCNKVDIVTTPAWTHPAPDPTFDQATSFTLYYSVNSLLDVTKPCAKVTVQKGNSGARTKVTSIGQSRCSDTDPRVVQRTVEATY